MMEGREKGKECNGNNLECKEGKEGMEVKGRKGGKDGRVKGKEG